MAPSIPGRGTPRNVLRRAPHTRAPALKCDAALPRNGYRSNGAIYSMVQHATKRVTLSAAYKSTGNKMRRRPTTHKDTLSSLYVRYVARTAAPIYV